MCVVMKCAILNLSLSVFIPEAFVMFYTPTHDEEQTVWFFVSVIFATWLMSRAEASTGSRGSSGCFVKLRSRSRSVEGLQGQRTQNSKTRT